MEDKDLELIRKHVEENEDLRKLWEEHLELKSKLEEFAEKKYLSTEDEMRRKQLQKLKLAGKDRLMDLLDSYR